MPVWMALLLALALGFGMIATSLAVSYRDVQYILPVFTQMLLYASPVAFPLSMVKNKHPGLYPWFCLNPLAGVLGAFRWSVLGHGTLHVGAVAWSATFAAIMLFIGAATFKRMERKFADVI